MGRRSKSREISKERLGPDFSEDEATFYRKYFRKLRGKGKDFIERSKVKKFLQRSDVSEDLLEEILNISANESDVDLEAFCVACRLVAHAQELGAIHIGQVGEVPRNAPWFAETQEDQEKQVERGEGEPVPVEPGPPEDFDFEAVALGVDVPFSGRPSEPPESLVDMGQGASAGRKTIEAKARVAEISRPSGSATSLESSLAGSALAECQADPRTLRFERELVKGRAELDNLALKSIAEEQMSALRDKLEACRERHQTVRLQLAESAADARKLFSNLDFARQQIEDFERLVARLREARSMYSKTELELAKTKSKEGDGRGLQTHEDQRRAAELSEKVRRANRRKQDLQGKQQLLLARQRQAEHDRNDARKALDAACKKLLEIQAQRLQVCQDRHKAAQEASKLAKDCGLGPVLKELCQVQESSSQKSNIKELKRPQSGISLAQHSWKPSSGERPENGWALFGAGMQRGGWNTQPAQAARQGFQQDLFSLPNMLDGGDRFPASRSPRVSRPTTPTSRTPGNRTPVGNRPIAAGNRTPTGNRTPIGSRTPMGNRTPVQTGTRTPMGVIRDPMPCVPATLEMPSHPPFGPPPPLETFQSGARTPPLGARTPCRIMQPGTPRGATTPLGPGRSSSGRGGTPRRAGGVTPPLLTPNASVPYLGSELHKRFDSSDDGIIVDGRWATANSPSSFQPMLSVKEAFYVPEPPVPTGPKALPWLPSRTTQNPDFKMLTQEKFLERLDAVCDSFQPLDSASTYLIEVKGDEAPQSPRAFQLANAEGALSRLVEEAMWSGPIRHMAICVLAQRVIMLADSLRTDPDNAPGGRELMVALLSSVKQMCAANTGDITISRNDKFSGRIVLLLGSASCTGEQLLKDCSEHYRDIDQNCMLIAVSMGAEPAGSAQLGKTIAAAVNAWGEAEAKNGPPGTAGGAGRPELLIHLFGGAGFAAWAKILKLWKEQSHYPDEKRLTGRMLSLDKILKGVVLDSAPGDSGTTVMGAFPMVQGDAALLSAMNSYGADGSTPSEAQKMQATQRAMRDLTKKNGALWEYYETIIAQDQGLPMQVHQYEPTVPLLFVFSDSDKIAPAAQIERYLYECELRQAQRVSDNGLVPVPVPRVLHLETSAHVAHRVGSTEVEYWKSVHDFWRFSLFC